MNKLCLVIIVNYLFGTSLSSALTLSSTNDGICVAVGAWRAGMGFFGGDIIQYDDKLLCEFISTLGDFRLDCPNAAFAWRIRMFGPDGTEIAKTEAGQQIGVKFNDILSHPDGRSKGEQGYPTVPYYDRRDEMFGGPLLPAPQDWFQMERPGIYILELEMQVLRRPRNTNETLMQIVRIPQVRIKVEKPLTAPFSIFSVTNQGVCISIIGTKTNGLGGFDDALQWRVFCENQHSLLHSLDLSCGFKMNLRGPDGKEVPKTALGQTIGSKFDEVQTVGKLPSGTILSDLDFRSGLADIVPAKPLPRLRDCFAMDRPGIYTLELQIQLFRITYKTAGEPEPEQLLRFPPMTIKVNRP